MNFSEFLSSRDYFDDIFAAADTTPECMNLQETAGGWLYSKGIKSYFIVKLSGDQFGCLIDDEVVNTWTIEEAEARLFASIEDTEEVDQFLLLQERFGDYDDIIPVVKGYSDQSWGNDSCPKLGLYLPGYESHIWLDYRNPQSRELGPEGRQFTLCVGTEDDGSNLLSEDFVDFSDHNIAHRALKLMYTDWANENNFSAEVEPNALKNSYPLNEEQTRWIEEYQKAWSDSV